MNHIHRKRRFCYHSLLVLPSSLYLSFHFFHIRSLLLRLSRTINKLISSSHYIRSYRMDLLIISTISFNINISKRASRTHSRPHHSFSRNNHQITIKTNSIERTTIGSQWIAELNDLIMLAPPRSSNGVNEKITTITSTDNGSRRTIAFSQPTISIKLYWQLI